MCRMSTRRAFLATAGTAAATVWIPRPVKGYTAAEMRGIDISDVGISKWDLDTPALCVDLDRLEQSVRQVLR